MAAQRPDAVETRGGSFSVGRLGRAVRTPTMIERTGSVLVAAFPTSSGTGTASLVSNPEFDSEVLIAYETGYRW